MKYPIAEKFKSLQGEGLYTGVPMAFIRLVGCSVGQKVCTACDTDFDKVYAHLGGGMFTPAELVEWMGDYTIANITGGEPFDRELAPLVDALQDAKKRVHIETSGTVAYAVMRHGDPEWVCVSPKPGYRVEMLELADEIKPILHGLGDGPGWMQLPEMLEWASRGKLVYMQPRNFKNQPDEKATFEVVSLVKKFPQLRASFQLHKILNER